jgi:hypothetical protein
MGGGTTSRGGFYFQDLVLADRVLIHLLAARKAVADGTPVPISPEFRVEGPGDGNGGPDWDVVELSCLDSDSSAGAIRSRPCFKMESTCRYERAPAAIARAHAASSRSCP